jgi:hypothetical protein
VTAQNGLVNMGRGSAGPRFSTQDRTHVGKCQLTRDKLSSIPLCSNVQNEPCKVIKALQQRKTSKRCSKESLMSRSITFPRQQIEQFTHLGHVEGNCFQTENDVPKDQMGRSLVSQKSNAVVGYHSVQCRTVGDHSMGMNGIR